MRAASGYVSRVDIQRQGGAGRRVLMLVVKCPTFGTRQAHVLLRIAGVRSRPEAVIQRCLSVGPRNRLYGKSRARPSSVSQVATMLAFMSLLCLRKRTLPDIISIARLIGTTMAIPALIISRNSSRISAFSVGMASPCGFVSKRPIFTPIRYSVWWPPVGTASPRTNRTGGVFKNTGEPLRPPIERLSMR